MPRQTLGFSCRTWAIAILVALIGFATTLTGCSNKLMRRRRARWEGITMVLMGLHNYHDAHGCLPRPYTLDKLTQPSTSWRFALMNFLEASNTVVSQTELSSPWNAPVNEKWRKLTPTVFCFGDKGSSTNVVGVVGLDTVFDPSRDSPSWGDYDIDAILVVEIRDVGWHWMAPRDLTLKSLLKDGARIGGPDFPVGPDGFYIGFADGQVWLMATDTPLSVLLPFLSKTGSFDRDREVDLAPFAVVSGKRSF